MKNILLFCGGGGSEHDISLLSADYIEKSLNSIDDFKITRIEIGKNENKEIIFKRLCGPQIDYAIPCLHGYPGETGDIQSIFEIMKIPYLGSGPEASRLCFNKVSSKLWFSALEIPNTPYIFLSSEKEIDKASTMLEKYGDIFVKTASEGSSVGCYHVTNQNQLKKAVDSALKLSPYILIEKTVSGRELEIAVYQYNGKIITSDPGEIISPNSGFYTYEEKYSSKSHTKTAEKAMNISQKIKNTMKTYALNAFKGLKLRHLSRIDFFLTDNEEIYLNEINTFPGMTPISMFPKMMEASGLNFSDFLEKTIRS